MKLKFVLLVFCLTAISAFAEKASFQATVNSNRVVEGENFQVSFTLNNRNGSQFKAPAFKGFKVLSGPNPMYQSSNINGRMSSSVSYTYLLKAEKKGKFTIGPASIVSDGKQLQTNSIDITVVEPSQQVKQQRQQAKNEEQRLSKDADAVISKNLYINTTVSKSEVYQGEQIIVTYKLYYHPDLRVVENSSFKPPILSGFWSQSLDDPKGIKPVQEIINGIPFNVYTLKKTILIPQKAGNLIVDPITMDFKVQLVVQNQKKKKRGFDPFEDFFDDPFFGGNSYKVFDYTAKSKAYTINVKPLPTNSLESFKGAVGNLSMEAVLDKNQTKTNEPVTLKVTISGTGNLKLIEAPDIKLPPDMEKFEPKLIDKTVVSINGVSGSKTFEYLLIPRQPGEYKIEPVKFTYFDLSKKQYITLTSNNFTISVEKGNTPAASASGKEELNYLEQDIRHIKKLGSAELSKGDEGFFNSFTHWLLIISPIALLFVFLIIRKKKKELNENQALLNNKRATRIAKQQLSLAQKYMKANERDKFFEEISHALWLYLNYKFNIPVSDLTKDLAAETFTQKNLPEELGKKYLALIEHCDFARFAPSYTVSIEPETIYNDSVKCISDIEELLK